jgi:hypothetical protein
MVNFENMGNLSDYTIDLKRHLKDFDKICNEEMQLKCQFLMLLTSFKTKLDSLKDMQYCYQVLEAGGPVKKGVSHIQYGGFTNNIVFQTIKRHPLPPLDAPHGVEVKQEVNLYLSIEGPPSFFIAYRLKNGYNVYFTLIMPLFGPKKGRLLAAHEDDFGLKNAFEVFNNDNFSNDFFKWAT